MAKKKNVEEVVQDSTDLKLQEITEKINGLTEKLRSSRTTTQNFGYGSNLPDYLTVLFVAFKLSGIISWPWVWVLAPFWIPLGLVVIAAIVLLCVLWKTEKSSEEKTEGANV